MIGDVSSSEPLELMIQVEAGAKMISNNYILPINATTSNIVINELPITCDIPTNLHETDLTSDGITLNWNDMNADVYRLIGRKQGNSTWKVFDPQTDNFRSFTSGLQATTCYEWSVKAKCDGVWTDWQEVREFCTSSAKNQSYEPKNDPFLTENQAAFITEINVFPNPTSDYINLSFMSMKTESLDIVLSDILGKTVLSKTHDCDENEQNIRLNVSDLPKGTYFLQIMNKEDILSVEKVSIF